jgi:hypothetical protein
MRSICGKRSAMPLSWQVLAFTPSKPGSQTSGGRFHTAKP